MPSHLGEKGKEKQRADALASGLVTEDDMHGNDQADTLAKQGASLHGNLDKEKDIAMDNLAVIVTVQRMYLKMWEMQLDAETQEVQNMTLQDEHDLDRIQSNILHEAGEYFYDNDPFEDQPERRAVQSEPVDTCAQNGADGTHDVEHAMHRHP